MVYEESSEGYRENYRIEGTQVYRHWVEGGESCFRCSHYITPEPGDVAIECCVMYENVYCTLECALAQRAEVLTDLDPDVCRVCEDSESVYAGVCLECVNEERAARWLPLAAQCVICNEVFFPVNGEGCCSEPCTVEARRELSHRRRARELAAFVEDVNRHEVFERDGYVCQLCDLPIDMNLEFPHRLFPTIDHIIPLAAGGMHEPGNVQAAHFACNSAKGAKLPV